MAEVNAYKRFEKKLVQNLKTLVFFICSGTAFLAKKTYKILARRYTIVFVPESEKKVYNLRINNAIILCFAALLIGGIASFYWYRTTQTQTTARDFPYNDRTLAEVQAGLDQLRDETATLLREVRAFERALSDTFSVLGTDFSQNSLENGAAFINVTNTSAGLIPEVYDMRRLIGYFSAISEPIKEINALLDAQNTLLAKIPSIWPVQGGIGHVITHFGQTTNTFTGEPYMHTGIDISTGRQGDSVVATANGQVVVVNSDNTFGNYVIIRHRHGFYTRYAHMLGVRVATGQHVEQGEVIGYIGNTGLSTEPHLHYEVIIGSDVVDPYNFINIRSNIAVAGNP